jgi:hypothetical protein
MKRRAISVALIAVLFGVFTLPSALARPIPAAAGVAIPITGTFTDATGGAGRFAGTFNIQRFAQDGNQIVAVGTLTGTLTDALGNVLGSIVKTVSLILDSAATQASCEILHLELGPLDLNLLGLTVHLNKVVLDISAQSGPGNLLGNLLCAVANLLNGGGPLSQIVNLLNQILALL